MCLLDMSVVTPILMADEPGLDYIFMADNFVCCHLLLGVYVFGLGRFRNLLQRKENLSFSLSTDILGTI